MAIRRKFRLLANGFGCGLAAILLLGVPVEAALAQDDAPSREPPAELAPTYADLVELAMDADLVGIVRIDDQITFPPERATGVEPGYARLYIESLTQTVLAAPRAIGEELVFIVDVPLDQRGKAPNIEKLTYLVFGDLDATRPRDLQLLSSDAMLPAGPVIEARVREVLTQLAAPQKPEAVTGIKDVISIPGNLAGESETQIFVQTQSGAPVSMNVIRRPGMAPRWGVSLGDIVDPAARPPAPGTLAWYHFACHLPRALPEESFLQRDSASREQARADYAFILADLGPCERRY